MKLTEQQKLAVKFEGNAFVEACPGSGKTRTLVAKALRCLDEVRETPRRIACITYTNAGVYEIDGRLRRHGTSGDSLYYEVSTIHSFCLTNILRHFYWRLPERRTGFEVLPSDSEHYIKIARDVCTDFGFQGRMRSQALANFENLNRQPDGTPIAPDPLTEDAASAFWERLEEEGYIDFPNIIYLAYRLISEYPEIARAISSRFAWLLVDEFQDTSALQVEILRLIADQGKTKFFLVGDPYQSIFSFAGARVDLMREFARYISANGDFKLLANFRSGGPIIRHAERLIPRTPPMHPEGECVAYNDEPRYRHEQTALKAITEVFLPTVQEAGISLGNVAILSPQVWNLFPLGRQLRAKYGIPVTGPGARPYNRRHLLAPLAELICAYIEDPDPILLPRIATELFRLVNDITKQPNFEVYSYRGRLVIWRIIKIAEELRGRYEYARDWLLELGTGVADVLCSFAFLSPLQSKLIVQSATQIVGEISPERHGGVVFRTLDLGIFAHPDKNLKLLTIHRAKGREFNAVAIVDLHESRLPHWRAVNSGNDSQGMAESRRVLYVAITRARRLLYYFTDDENARIGPSRFLRRDGLGLI